MKYLNFSIFFFLLFSIFLTKDVTNSPEEIDESNQAEVSGEFKKLRESNNKKFKEIINEYIKQHNLDNNIITRDQFKDIFYKLFEFGEKELNPEDTKNINNNKEYINNIFNNLVKEDKKEIEVDKIIELFEPINILYALRDTVSDIGSNNAGNSFSKDLLNALNSLEEKSKKKENEKNTDL